jgi:outer membrane protein OmpA-like peptidoglycan-associated protein
MIPENSETIEILSDVLNEVLPCAGSTPPERCNSKYPGAVDAVMIEGHTDSTGSALANLELSQRRAFETYSMITSASRTLADIHNSRGETILGSGGYGEERPLPNTERDSSLNRRVEIRLIMRQPKLVGDAQITR